MQYQSLVTVICVIIITILIIIQTEFILQTIEDEITKFVNTIDYTKLDLKTVTFAGEYSVLRITIMVQ